MFYRAAQSQCAIDHKVTIRFPQDPLSFQMDGNFVVIQSLDINNSLHVLFPHFYLCLIGNIWHI